MIPRLGIRLSIPLFFASFVACSAAPEDELALVDSDVSSVQSALAGQPLKVQFKLLSSSSTAFSATVRVTNISSQRIGQWFVSADLPATAVVTSATACKDASGATESCVAYYNASRDYRNNHRFTGPALEPGRFVDIAFSGTLSAGNFTGPTGCRTTTYAIDRETSAPVYTSPVPCNGGDDVTAPAPVMGASWCLASATAANLSWTAASDASGIQGYRIYQSWPYSNSSTNVIADVATNSYQIKNLTPGTYLYVVSAIDKAGNESDAVNASRFVVRVQSGPSFTFQKTNEWSGGASGYEGQITVRNDYCSGNISDWSFSFVQPGVSSLWNAKWAVQGDRQFVTAPKDWSPGYDVLVPGESVSIGFTVGNAGASTLPGECQFRGTACLINTL